MPKSIEEILSNKIQPEPVTSNESDRELIKHIRKMLMDSKRAMDSEKRNYVKWRRRWLGHHWDIRRHRNLSMIVVNMTFVIIESILATLVEDRPTIQVNAKETSDERIASIFHAVMEHVLYQANFMETIIRWVRDSLIYGIGYVKPYVDENGDIQIDVLDPFQVWLDTSASKWDNMEYIIYTPIRDIGYLRRKYGEKASNIKPDAEFSDPDIYKEYSNNPTFFETWQLENKGEIYTMVDTPKAEQFPSGLRVLTIEAHFRDGTMEEVPQVVGINPDGTPREEMIKRPKYPNGRIVVFAGDTILFDQPNPYPKGMFGIVPLWDYERPQSVLGIGEPEILETLQQRLTRLAARIDDWITYTVYPQRVMDSTSGLTASQLTNIPDTVYTVTPNSRVDFIRPPDIPGTAITFFNTLMQLTREISGIYPTASGQQPQSIRSGVGIAEAKRVAVTRINPRIVNLENALTRLGRLLVPMIQKTFPDNKIIRIVGPEGQRYYERVNQTIDPETGLPITDSEGRPTKLNDISAVEFDVVMSPAKTIGKGTLELQNLVLTLWNQNVIDRQAVLETLKFPGYQNVLDRIQKQEAMMREQQSQIAIQNQIQGQLPSFPQEQMMAMQGEG